MKICVWHTNHPIADTVAKASNYGLLNEGHEIGMQNAAMFNSFEDVVSIYDIHIGYGILRGMADVFRECGRQGKPWFCIDRGYWKPGHYDGYYRVSLRGTQQTGGWPNPDYTRWQALGLMVEPPKGANSNLLVCPPTDYAKDFFKIDNLVYSSDGAKVVRLRCKDADNESLDNALAWADRVATFNSSVGWEVLRRGIAVESDPVHSIIGAWQAKHGVDKRAELFAIMACLQLTLNEMRGGMLLPLMEKLLAN